MFTHALHHTFCKYLIALVIATAVFAPLTFVFAQGNPIFERNTEMRRDSVVENSDTPDVLQPEDRGFGNSNTPDASVTDTNSTAETSDTDSNAGAGGPPPVVERNEKMGEESGDWTAPLQKGFYDIMRGAGGMVTWVGGNMLDWSIEKLVIGFGSLLRENLGVAVEEIWSIVRDTMNIVFIFALIWIGLKTILYSDDSAYKKSLGYLIAAALLINFSLFITKAVIDFTNIAAIQISNAFVVERTGADGEPLPYLRDEGLEEFGSDGLDTYISAAFMESMKLSSYASELTFDERGLAFTVGFSLLVFAMMVIAGFVFMAGAILMIVRFVVLVLVMMFSPIMFAGWIYPKLKKFSDQWMNIFLYNAFVAPAYLFMLYIALAVIGTANEDAGTFGFNNGAIADAGTGSSTGFGIILHYTLVIGFLIAAIKIAEQMSTHGSKAVNSVGMAGANWVRGVAMSPVNYGKDFGRNVGAATYEKVAGVPGTNLGFRGKDYKAAEEKLKERRAKKKEDRKWGDSAALTYAWVRGAGSLDDRQANLKKGQEYKPLGGKSFKEKEDAKKTVTAENTQRQSRADLINSIDAGLNAKTDSTEYITMVDKITSASPTEISKVLNQYDKAGESKKYQTVVDNLSPNQFKKVLDLKEEDFSEKSKGKLKAGRKQSTQTKLKWNEKEEKKQDLKTGLKQASVADLATLDFNDDILANAAYLQGTQLDDMKKDDFFGGPRFNAIKSRYESQLKQWLDNEQYDEIISTRKGSGVNIAKLPADVLKSEDFMAALDSKRKLTIGLLSQIASSKDIDDEDKPLIGDAARRAITANPRHGGDLPDTYRRFFGRGVGQNLTDGDY